MNVSITFRHMDASEAIKQHASDKIAKLQKFLRQPVTAKVTVFLDKLKHVAEVQMSSGGAHLEAKESSDDMYASIDRAIEKLATQIRGAKGAVQARRRAAKTTVRGGDATPKPSAVKAKAKAKASKVKAKPADPRPKAKTAAVKKTKR